jgi:3'-5' exoribonuclease
MRKTITIKELKAGGTVDDLFAVRLKKSIGPYRNGTLFHLWVSDPGGDISLKYWGEKDASVVKKIWDGIVKGSVIQVKGKINEYNGSLEIHVNPTAGEFVKVLSEGEFDIKDFVASSTVDTELMKAQLFSVVRKVEDPWLKDLLSSFLSDEDFVRRFCECPGSITHHANWLGGLLEHTLRVVKLCEFYAQLYPDLNHDLMLTGAVLHDIGKLREYTVTSIIGATDEGRLVGHLVIGASMVHDACRLIEGFPPELALKVQHLVLSSHGTLEYGSPKVPLFPEAQALALADLTDSKVEDMITVRKTAVTEDDWAQDRSVGSVYLK